jgi:hypothetical protein
MSSFPIQWPGLSGNLYTFETYPIGTAFNHVGGVYIFCKGAANGDWHALYVGETHDFNDRLNTGLQGHDAWPSCRFAGATHLSVMVIGGPGAERERLRVETELRHSLRPPYNRQAA